MKLHFSATSPFVRKVMICAHEKAVVDRIELLEGADVAATNPLSKVPALILNDGECVYDSLVICDHIDNLDGSPSLIPADARARTEVLCGHALANGIMDAALASVMETRRPADKIWQDLRDTQHGKISRALDSFEARAGGYGTRVDLATISLAAAIGYLNFRLGDLGWLESRGNLAGWYATFSQRPSMLATAPPV